MRIDADVQGRISRAEPSSLQLLLRGTGASLPESGLEPFSPFLLHSLAASAYASTTERIVIGY